METDLSKKTFGHMRKHFGAHIRQKLVKSEAEIRQFGSYNVLIMQNNRHRNLKYFNKIV